MKPVATEKQIVARARNWEIRRIRMIKAISGQMSFTPEELAAIQTCCDKALKRFSNNKG